MGRVVILSDPEECRRIWEQVFPPRGITDLWEVRDCFQQRYRRPLCFLVARDSRGIAGLLPLSWVEESGEYAFFPGETSGGRTWLEQNRIYARDAGTLRRLLAHCPGPYHLRYISPLDTESLPEAVVDETNYFFAPPEYGFDMENYYCGFSRKRLKRLRRELGALEERGFRYRYDHVPDFEEMVRLSLERHGEDSYFHDPRFCDGFRRLTRMMADRDWLRITTILDGDRAIAVDLGCIYGGTYTLFAGGTHGEYPGIAKQINLHHMERACREGLREVDFLCGSFTWKTLFHLAERPLYLLSTRSAVLLPTVAADTLELRSRVHVG